MELGHLLNLQIDNNNTNWIKIYIPLTKLILILIYIKSISFFFFNDFLLNKSHYSFYIKITKDKYRETDPEFIFQTKATFGLISFRVLYRSLISTLNSAFFHDTYRGIWNWFCMIEFIIHTKFRLWTCISTRSIMILSITCRNEILP